MRALLPLALCVLTAAYGLQDDSSPSTPTESVAPILTFDTKSGVYVLPSTVVTTPTESAGSSSAVVTGAPAASASSSSSPSASGGAGGTNGVTLPASGSGSPSPSSTVGTGAGSGMGVHEGLIGAVVGAVGLAQVVL
ncbi:uncharacterized protein BDR25DRAFT_303789 [Lindgomyces ingoldianus]|uniref:Uncharacterized protein n=1 Tax=Lindgomyces ingoldianus TaxID=673940 RepID=A0ACB6QXL4_9PLEO|nr:uncharacterized protein BDR25DRAFT_303789 [Lindgomyces ingoldianus]KAF2470827.1 hypothetical protein BDR25DRAFT_303789 [Lindgomyces ingoldianus]